MQSIPLPMRTRRKPWSRVVLVSLCAAHLAVAAACAKATAASVPDGPPLAVPVAPARVIAPVEEVLVAGPVPVVTTSDTAASPRTPARETPPRSEPKPDPPPAVAAPPAPPPPVAATEGREIRAVPAASAAAEDKKIKDLIARAEGGLTKIDYQKLSSEGKAQYEQSRRFAVEARQALADRNYVYALTLADKAATLAAELPSRR